MRILAIAHEKEINGASRSMFALLKHLNATNEITLFIPFSEDSEVEREAINCGFRVLKGRYSKWMKQSQSEKSYLKQRIMWYCFDSRRNERLAKRLSEYVKANGIELVYTNTRVIDLGARIKRLTGIKHLWHIREFGEEDFQYRTMNSVKKHWGTIIKYTDRIVANSNAVAHKILEKTNNKVPVCTVYNGIEPIHIQNKQFREDIKDTNAIQFLISGRISKAKGHDVLLRAVEILLSDCVDNFVINVAGSGDIAALGDEFKKSPAIAKFVFHGKVDEIWNLRKSMDVELMCSRCEAFGRVTVEAMMSMLLVIGSDSGGTAELIEDKVTGLLFRPGSPADLAIKMRDVIERPSQIRAIAPIAQKYAIEHFGVSAYLNQMSNVLESLCELQPKAVSNGCQK